MCLSIYLCIYLSIYLPIYVSIYFSIFLYIDLSIDRSIYLFLPITTSIYLCLIIYPSICLNCFSLWVCTYTFAYISISRIWLCYRQWEESIKKYISIRYWIFWAAHWAAFSFRVSLEFLPFFFRGNSTHFLLHNLFDCCIKLHIFIRKVWASP